ncbi:GNAT family N-acetyltransferase [Bacillus carboniphilus]
MVREANELDEEKFLDYTTQALRDAPYMLTTLEDIENMTVQEGRSVIKGVKELPNYALFIAEIDNHIVGSIDFKNGDKEKMRHQGSIAMTVHPDFRNDGIGRALLETLLGWAKNNTAIEKVSLRVMERNVGAIRLYKKFGFLEEGREVRGIKEKEGYQDLILMAIFV